MSLAYGEKSSTLTAITIINLTFTISFIWGSNGKGLQRMAAGQDLDKSGVLLLQNQRPKLVSFAN